MLDAIQKLKGKLAKDKISVGLDIGTSAVKMVKLKTVKDEVELIGFSIEPVRLDLEQALISIAKLLDASRVNISFSGPTTIIRYATFLKMNPQELKQALKFEAQKHIPFPVQDVNLDGYILKTELPDNKMLVMLAAVKKEFMNQRLKLVESSGLKTNLAGIDSIALINAFNFSYPADQKSKDSAVALLNIGATNSNFNIVEEGIPRLSRDIPIAGNILTQKIADSLGVDFKSAETEKLSPERLQAQKTDAAVEPVISNLAGEIRISCDYYESQSASTVEKIFLSGGSGNSKGLKEALSSLLGIEVEYWDPLKKIKLGASVDSDKILAASAQLAVAVGLALQG